MTNWFNKNILTKYLNGNTSLKEEENIEKIFVEEGESSKIKELVKDDWNHYLKVSQHSKDQNLEHVLNKVHHTIRTKENNHNKRITHKIIKWYSVVAATLLIPIIVIGTLYIHNLYELNAYSKNDSLIKVSCPLGGKMAFTLPDGTHGMLNSGSFIEYHLPFEFNRNINISGEVYFDVFHDTKHPFQVNSNNAEITVLGTQFNIKAYPDESMTEIVLIKGKVSCKSPYASNEMILKPDEQIRIQNKKVTKFAVDAKSYIAWKDGKLILRGDSMSEVIQKLSRWYNVDIEVMDKEIASYSFRGTFIDDTLDEVLKLLKLTSPIEYKLLERKKADDGSWSPRKVQLFKRKN